MPYKPREIESKLTGKFGFVEDDVRDPDHRWYVLKLKGLPPIRTKVSHSKAEIRKRLEGKISREIHVRNSYFKDMMDCTNSREDYYNQVRTAPYPPFLFHTR